MLACLVGWFEEEERGEGGGKEEGEGVAHHCHRRLCVSLHFLMNLTRFFAFPLVTIDDFAEGEQK